MSEITITSEDGTIFTIEPLPTEARDTALGRYMDAFARLEGMIKFTTQELFQINYRTANAISAAIMTKQAIDLLQTAAKIHLDHIGANRAVHICGQLIRRNMRRNNIIHGAWKMVVVVTDGSHTTEWVRTYDHVDPAISDLRPGDPKLAGTYTFTIRELDKATYHVEEMVLALSALAQDIPSLRVPPQTPAQ